ncbi:MULTISPECIES: basic amino acid ABC transporter substrate-binding protein [Neobacillus]|jgi:glutamine transport system substrate-binding protein|uniref:Basic amino acid ABC transporter substrate-binding protein n=1 Tax=Neobacillus sedimentimangrovi TaxID=2699460 RepID=A0ABS8QG53_9BACI|nr:basic amino acid ABC transporter substrate-binding protein [Neobacillus sedimentimangrovi]MCD4838239.1 basic amino acid ABC transporter substrate-binding protein [Neobacillus sedimentimangrovi]
MKKFKWMATLIVSAFLLVLSACGASETSGGGEKKKTLRVVTDAAYAPFEYQDKGEVVGFDVDFIKAVAKQAGYEVKVEHVGWDPLFVEIKGKTADLAVSAITINDDRKQTYDFSVPYFLSTNKILIPKDSDIKSAADLKDKVVAVQNGTTGQEAVETLLGKENKNVKKFKDNNLAIMELKNGGADAVVADNTVIEEYVKNNPNENFIVIEDEGAFDKEFYGVLFPKESKLKAEFDKAIKEMMENGEYAKIYKKWFKVDPDLSELKAQQ